MAGTSEDPKNEEEKCGRCGGSKILFNNTPCPECQPNAAALRADPLLPEKAEDQTEPEKRKGPPPTDWDEIYTGYGIKFKRIEGTSALREVDNDSTDWDQCVYHMIGGRVQRFRMDDTPDPTKGNPNV